MNGVKSILLVGVGGQGTILASKLLSIGLLQEGYDVKMSEIHGMSQRGGSVTTMVRFGDKVYAPTIGLGEADLIIAFEKMEGYRYLPYLKHGGRIIVNDYEIPSAPILMGECSYPADLKEAISSAADATFIDAAGMAREIGQPKAMNVVLLGAMVKSLGLTDVDWETIIRENVKPGFVEGNIKAVRRGMESV
ncbi:MAG: indolepyruvate oxidoreductase subunit beta [Anaerovoracaceae bacterium]|jgi:indolepyruvate ferredoxin oxidoreductase beta subunit